MLAQIVVVVAAVVVLQVVPQIEALQCYQCDSGSNTGCADPFVLGDTIGKMNCGILTGQSFGAFGPSSQGQQWGQGGQPGQPGQSWGQGGQPGQPGQSWGQGGQPGQSWGQGQPGQPGQSGFGGGQTYCRKLVNKMPDGRMHVQRACSLGGGFQGGSSSSSSSDGCTSIGDGYDCRCFTDFCNGAPDKSKMALLPLVAVAALVAYFGRQ